MLNRTKTRQNRQNLNIQYPVQQRAVFLEEKKLNKTKNKEENEIITI